MIAVTALGVSTAGFAPVAAHAAPQANFVVTHITCHQQEDFNGADDAYLVVGGRTIYGPVQFTSGDSKDTATAAFGSGQVLTLMEADWPDADDNLGAHRIDHAGDYQYTDDGAHYTVTVANG
ncbi:hypothetical protein [Kribbella sp. NPDC055071]